MASRKELAEVLQISEKECTEILSPLMREEKLVRVGTRYYLAGAIVHPEKHYEMIREYLEENGTAMLSALAELLRLDDSACSYVISNFVKEGKLVLNGRRYMLPGTEDQISTQARTKKETDTPENHTLLSYNIT